LDELSVLEAFEDAGIAQVHARTLWRHIIQNDVTDYHSIPEFPRKACEIFDKEFTLCTSQVVQRTDASDGSTTKLMIQLQDGKLIETVIMRYGDVELRSFPEQEKMKRKTSLEDVGDDKCSVTSTQRRFKSNRRATVCVSSQVTRFCSFIVHF
jgi:adenine C2-methylase RlmN of 23S rRNA A2503 and tRNA A37